MPTPGSVHKKTLGVSVTKPLIVCDQTLWITNDKTPESIGDQTLGVLVSKPLECW